MTKAGALDAFFNSFGIPFYPSTSVPEDTVFPWGTYDAVFDAWGGEQTAITANLWYRTASEKTPNDMVNTISKKIGDGGIRIPCDEGAIWIKRGTPFCQNLSDETDDMIKRRYINLTAEYLTIY